MSHERTSKAASMAKRILIFANKTWETDPLVAVLTNARATPPDLPPLAAAPTVTVPLNKGGSKKVSARLAFRTAAAVTELWCVQDLMDPAKSSASSEEKARVLPYVAKNGAAPDLVIAFGTASYPDATSYNGSAVIGTNAFVYNAYPKTPNPNSNWKNPNFGKLITSDLKTLSPILSKLDMDVRIPVESRFIATPLNPAKPPVLMVASNHIALSDVNVTNPADYVWADPAALAAAQKAAPQEPVGSMETTHGVIRLSVPSDQFLFVSAIANRLGFFNAEVAPRSYAQNFVPAHNAGIALAWLLPLLMA
jgi:hypothetical protein